MLNKAEGAYLVIARDLSEDANDGAISLSKIIDTFNFEVDEESMKKKGMIAGERVLIDAAKYVVASAWYLSGTDTPTPYDLTFDLDITDPNGRKLGGPSNKIQIQKKTERININLMLTGIPFTVPGPYMLHVELLYKGKLIGRQKCRFAISTYPSPSSLKKA